MSVLERVREVESTRGAAEQAPVSLRLVRERLKGALVERMGLSVIAGMLSSEDAKLVRDELAVALDCTPEDVAVLLQRSMGEETGQN